MQITHYCLILIEVEHSRCVFEKYSNINFHEMSPEGDNEFQQDGRTDRLTDMATLTIASRDFANGPKNRNLKYAFNTSKINVLRKGEKLRTNEKWRMNGHNTVVVYT